MIKLPSSFFSSKTFLPALIFVFLLIWIIGGRSFIQDLSNTTPEEYVEEQIERLKKVDPEAASALIRLQETREAKALASALKIHDETLSTLRAFAKRAKDDHIPYEVQLTDLAYNARLPRSDQDLEGFFYAHATTSQLLTNEPSGEALSYYLDLLRQAQADPLVWQVVFDDPVGLLLWPSIDKHPQLWNFYRQNRDWLAEVLAQLAPLNSDLPAESMFVEAITVAQRFDPLPRQAVMDHELGPNGFSLFMVFGPVIKQAVIEHGLPLDETLEVLFNNADQFDPGDPNLPGYKKVDADYASQLAYIFRNKPNVWHHARLYPMVIRLNNDAPQYAESLLKQYGSDDITTFLYSTFDERAVPAAAAAIVHFHDLALHLFNRYGDDERLQRYLADPDVGIRIIPFLARFGDQGFDRLDSDSRWIERYFATDGTPREDGWGWIQSVPIAGAPANLINNVINGYPNEWSEIGWAALDVADGILLVASFGSSFGLTAVRQTGKQVAKSEARTLIRYSAQKALKSSAGNSRAVVRQASRASPLRSLATTTRSFYSTSGYLLAFGTKVVAKTGQMAWASARRIKDGWRNVSPNIRLWTYRSLLGVGILVTLKERTIPMLPQVGEATGKLAGELIAGSVGAVGAALTAAVREIAPELRLSSAIQKLIYWAVLMLLLYWVCRELTARFFTKQTDRI